MAQSDIAFRLGRTKKAVESQLWRLGISTRAVRHNWTTADIRKLYKLSETTSQLQAAKIIGCSLKGIGHKSRRLGITWRGGFFDIRQLARELGITAGITKRLVDALIPGVQTYSNGFAKRYLITYEDAGRIQRLVSRKNRLGTWVTHDRDKKGRFKKGRDGGKCCQ